MEKDDRLLINKNALDMELIRQAATYYEIGSEAVEAVSIKDMLYEQYKMTDAEQALLIREQLTNAGTKFTEGSLASMVQSSQEHVDAYQKYLDAKLVADKLNVLKDAFSTRSHMLRDLVSLYATNYFTNDSVKVTNGAGADSAYATRKRLLRETAISKTTKI